VQVPPVTGIWFSLPVVRLGFSLADLLIFLILKFPPAVICPIFQKLSPTHTRLRIRAVGLAARIPFLRSAGRKLFLCNRFSLRAPLARPTLPTMLGALKVMLAQAYYSSSFLPDLVRAIPLLFFPSLGRYLTASWETLLRLFPCEDACPWAIRKFLRTLFPRTFCSFFLTPFSLHSSNPLAHQGGQHVQGIFTISLDSFHSLPHLWP